MASLTVKSTYSLWPETIQALEALTSKWHVSKTEALRRAIAKAVEQEGITVAPLSPLAALGCLQDGETLPEREAAAFKTAVRREREASERIAR